MPAGGKIEKDEAGEPTGYMEENAFLSYLKQIHATVGRDS